jgi:outer membrane receptor protein involved in Fe transport
VNVLWAGLLVAFGLPLLAAEQIHGTVYDPGGRPVAGAAVRILSATGTPVAEAVSDLEGKFALPLAFQGAFSISADGAGLGRVEQPLEGRLDKPIRLQFRLPPVKSEITVTASRGLVESPDEAAAIIDARDSAEMRTRPLPTIGHALEGGLGVLMQQTTAAQVSPILRGLTGYQVLNLVDGVRFNNSTFRSGPNQYLAFIAPGQAQRIETSLGPSSAQYGSDSLGGTIQVLTPEARFGSATRAVHGVWNLYGSSADWSGASDARISIGGRRAAFSAGASGARHNDMRAGRGQDSRHVFLRYFGLSGELARELIGPRMQDSGFSQRSADAKLAARLGGNQTLTLWYQQTDTAGSRGYRELWGGAGRLQADIDPQQLRFGYLRYEKLGWGALDTLSATFSANSQRDGLRRRTLRITDPLTTEENQVDAFGYSAQATTHLGHRQAVVFGGEWFDEHISASRNVTSAAGTVQATRPLYPDGSRYGLGGLFLQDRVQLGSKLQATLGGRWSRVRYETRADGFGTKAATQTFGDWTFNTSLAWQFHPALRLVGVAGRGFRAPNVNDLGAIGLNSLGYEIPAADAVPAGALLASSAAENATSLGRRLNGLGPERLLSYEAGLRLRTRRLEGRLQLFENEMYDPIVRRTLLFPADRVPATLSGLPVTVLPQTAVQRAQGVAAVATAFDPRAVKAFVNDGRSRYYGAEAGGRLRFGGHWVLEGGWSYIQGRDLNPSRPVRRQPPPQGTLALLRTGARFWWRAGVQLAGAQRRLNGTDLDDERIGASRSRNDIAAVFASTRLSPFISQGVFTPTGETLRQVQDRLLPRVADSLRVPLYPGTAGWLVANWQCGYALTERVSLTGGAFNLLDRNYRQHGSGVDAPGFSAYLGLRFRY